MRVIQADCRAKLTWNDINFIISVLLPEGGGQEALRNLLADENTRDLLLDEPAVFQAMLETPAQLSLSLEFYFYVLVRRVLLKAGIDDREVADYIAAVLAEFSRQFTRGRAPKAREAFFYVVDVLEEIERADQHRRFHLITTLGNQSLVLTSIFPDHIEYRARYRAAPGLGYYEAVGRAQFKAASRHRLAHEFQLDRIYAKLSDGFREVRGALNDMQNRLLFLGDSKTPDLPECN